MAGARMVIRAEDVLDGAVTPELAVQWDRRYANADLVRFLVALETAGPFSCASPWELEDERGIRRINASGYAALPFGEFHPELVEFLQAFLERNRDTALPNEAVSPWRAALARSLVTLLAEVAPSHATSAVTFTNGGAEAVETAVKLVRASRPGAPAIINFSGAYHGQSWMALTLTPNPAYQAPFVPLVPGAVTVPYGDLRALETTIAELSPDAVAGVILEPVQGEAGVVLPPPGYLRAVGELCGRYGIPIIADEVQTGLGRTGHWFESIEQGLEPDVITLAKPLSGGILAVGATIARREFFRRAFGGFGSFRAVTTFGGNSLAMAVALKSLNMLVEGDLPGRARRLGERGLARLRAVQERRPGLLEAVRGVGLLYGLQFQPVVRPAWVRGWQAEIRGLSGALGLQALHRAGVQANLSANASGTVRLTPPLNIPEELFETMFDRIERMADLNSDAWRMLLRSRPGGLRELADLARASRATSPPGPRQPARWRQAGRRPGSDRSDPGRRRP